MIIIRDMQPADCEMISHAFRLQGWKKPVGQFVQYSREIAAHDKDVLVAELDGFFAGYAVITWESYYPPFKEQGIPEIQDLNVLKKYQRRGVASHLMEEAEKRISHHAAMAGIGVGLTADYGAAQILYVKRGYVPDGLGVSQNEVFIKSGERIEVNDDLVLQLKKKLSGWSDP